jgi:hypothetical protein
MTRRTFSTATSTFDPPNYSASIMDFMVRCLGAGAGLISASPEQPAQPMAEVTSGTDERCREQVLDLVASPPDQPGRWRMRVCSVTATTTTYRASFPGSDTYGTASSPQVTISVRPAVTARLQASTVTKSQTITVTGSVAPNHHGQRVYLQRQANGAWKGVATATLTNASGYTLTATPPATGSFTYRVVKRADADHTSATSATLTVTVR